MFHVSDETRASIEAWLEARHGSDKERNELISRARSEGGSLREIAQLFNLSHTEVRRILTRSQG